LCTLSICNFPAPALRWRIDRQAGGGPRGGRPTSTRKSTPDAALCRRILGTCGSFNLRKAARSVSQLYDAYLQPCGLRSTQLALLTMLAAEGELSSARLARMLVVSSSTLSRNLGPLQRDGLVEDAGRRGRGKVLRLTTRGERVLMDAVPLWRAAQEKFTELVGGPAWSELNRHLAEAVRATRS
jgi:DNA-binding MarR family transcriptional regulator